MWRFRISCFAIAAVLLGSVGVLLWLLTPQSRLAPVAAIYAAFFAAPLGVFFLVAALFPKTVRSAYTPGYLARVDESLR